MMNNSTPRSNKKERKISIVFRRTDRPVHCSGVEALLLRPEDGALFSASRDTTIKRWDVATRAPKCTASFDAHADWVNGLAMFQDLLFSCSNDGTVRAWQAKSQGKLLSTMCHHSDYVTCLAAAQHKPLLASGGLRGEVFLIDAGAGSTHRLRPKPVPTNLAAAPYSPAGGPPAYHGYPAGTGGAGGWQPGGVDMNGGAGGASVGVGGVTATPAGIYSLATVPSGNILAAGSRDAMVRLWDTRSGEKVAKLRGHTDNVRALLIKDDCGLLLSGGADGTIKLWDLGMQRCIQTYVVHSDSVWCLAASPDWGHVYSGGRDRTVFRTRLATRTTELLAQEAHPVTSLAVDHAGSTLWVSTPVSTIHQWAVPRENASPRSSTHAGSRLRASSGYAGGLRKSVDTKGGIAPSSTTPASAIPGLPAITAHKVLSDRRRILARDEAGVVALWDVLAGQEIASYGKVDMEEQEAALFEARHMPSWFSADNRLGSLAITLEPPACFNAEDYAQVLGYAEATDDQKLNYGKLVLEGVFAMWKAKVLQSQQGGGGGVGPTPPAGAPQSAPTASPQRGAHQRSQQPVQQAEVQYYRDLWPRYWQGVHPIVMCSSAAGVPWQLPISGFTGRELEPEDVPSWVGDVVLRNALVTPRESKCAFVLLPAEGSGLPILAQSRLNAPRILQVYKVATYCLGRLTEHQVQLELRPVYLRPPQGVALPPPLSPHASGGLAGPRQLELLCNGVAVPYELSLSAVKKFIWCKQDDIIFHYRVLDPGRPAPLPVIHPPKR